MPGRTTARGYGSPHVRARNQHQAAITRGEGWCTEPICLMPDRWIPPGTPWDLAHNRTTGGYHGPAHARCNRAEGATYGNQTRPQQQRGPLQIRECSVCHTSYQPNHARQRCCGPACRAELPRLTTPTTPYVPTPKQCKQCGDTFTPRHPSSAICSDQCRAIRARAYARQWNRRHTEPHRAKEHPTVRDCEQCHQPFTPPTPNNRICSDECRTTRMTEYQHTYRTQRRTRTW